MVVGELVDARAGSLPSRAPLKKERKKERKKQRGDLIVFKEYTVHRETDVLESMNGWRRRRWRGFRAVFGGEKQEAWYGLGSAALPPRPQPPMLP